MIEAREKKYQKCTKNISNMYKLSKMQNVFLKRNGIMTANDCQHEKFSKMQYDINKSIF